MNVLFRPSRAAGTVAAPPSKTYAHRLLLAAALGTEPASVGPLEYSEDILATLDCVRSLGALVREEADGVRVIPGAGEPSDRFPCRESGSTLRFFLPLAHVRPTESVFTGSGRLMERPLSVYEAICREEGLLFERNGRELRVRGPLRPGVFRVRGDVSSQFLTGLCFALPILGGDSAVEIIPPLVSRPYLSITLSVLREAGIRVEEDGLTLRIPGNQTLRSPSGTVEGDCSNAAFPAAFDLLGGDVTVTGLNPSTLQGDAAYLAIYPQLAAHCPRIDLSDTPDLAPVCMALAGVLHGAVFTGAARLRLKESDRGAAMAQELLKFGIRAEVENDTIRVFPSEPKRPAQPIDSHNDHRVAMAASLLLSITGGELTGAEAVRKSWPGWFDALRTLGIDLETR